MIELRIKLKISKTLLEKKRVKLLILQGNNIFYFNNNWDDVKKQTLT